MGISRRTRCAAIANNIKLAVGQRWLNKKPYACIIEIVEVIPYRDGIDDAQGIVVSSCHLILGSAHFWMNFHNSDLWEYLEGQARPI